MEVAPRWTGIESMHRMRPGAELDAEEPVQPTHRTEVSTEVSAAARETTIEYN